MSYPSGITYAPPGSTYVAYTTYPTFTSQPVSAPHSVSVVSIPQYSLPLAGATASGSGITYVCGVTPQMGVSPSSYLAPLGGNSAAQLGSGSIVPISSISSVSASASGSGVPPMSGCVKPSPDVSASKSTRKVDPTLKATDQSKGSMKKVMDWVKALLDPETEMLWTNFLEFDERVEGKLDREEVKKMLQFFDSTASENDIIEYMKLILRGDANSVTFPELLDWWEKQKSSEGSRGSGVALRSMLMARFAGQKLKSWSWDLISKSSIEKRMDELFEYQIQNSLNQYSLIIVEIRRHKMELEGRNLDLEEDNLNKKFEDYLSQELKDASSDGELVLDDYDRYVLLSLFQHFADKCGNLAQRNLADIGNCINADFPASILRMTSRKYPDPMRESDFLKWCNARGVDAASSLTTKNLSKAALNRLNVFK